MKKKLIIGLVALGLAVVATIVILKVVLPSYKRGPFKLYAGNGVWLDMLLTYAKGQFHPTAWAFEDFKRNPYQHDLQLIRERYKKAGSGKNDSSKDTAVRL